MRAPARQVVSKQLNRAERALATPQRDRVGDVGAQRPGIARKMTRAEKIADVRNYPVIRALDNEIVIKLFNVLVPGSGSVAGSIGCPFGSKGGLKASPSEAKEFTSTHKTPGTFCTAPAIVLAYSA